MGVCLDYCKNFQYAALANGENCYCVDKFRTIDILPDSDCNVPCEGDTTNTKCGGNSKWSVYTIEEPEPLTGQCMKDQGTTDCLLIAFGPICFTQYSKVDSVDPR